MSKHNTQNYNMSNFSYITLNLSLGKIKTIILNTPEECLLANKIREKLIHEGYQLLPEALYPNEIHISYFEKENNQKNIIKTKYGSLAINFMS